MKGTTFTSLVFPYHPKTAPLTQGGNFVNFKFIANHKKYMGARRNGQEGVGHFPWKCCKVFLCISSDSQTLSRSIILQFFLEAAVVHLVVLNCVLKAATKKSRQLF